MTLSYDIMCSMNLTWLNEYKNQNQYIKLLNGLILKVKKCKSHSVLKFIDSECEMLFLSIGM